MSSKFQNDAIFWVEVEKINPNPYQPRRDFNEERLRDLAESIRQYGVLQPLTVTRKEETKDDGGLKVSYELIAGERRHRASQIAGLSQVPVIIRSGQEDSQVKLELAIIENLQREDLNPIERAEAFDQLAQEFDFTHKKIAEKIGKSREYVSNSMRLLKLPEKIKQAIISGQMTEGHARPIMMLRDNPDEQETLFKEVVHKGLTVREAESIARRDAQDKVRKKKNKIDPETKALEDRLSDTFGTRVKIEERDVGGKLVIDFFSNEDLENIIKLIQADGDMEMGDMMEHYVESVQAKRAEEADSEGEGKDARSQVEPGEGEKASDEAGKSMAETLGSMIAAARAKQQADEDTPAQPTEEGEVDVETPAAPATSESQIDTGEQSQKSAGAERSVEAEQLLSADESSADAALPENEEEDMESEMSQANEEADELSDFSPDLATDSKASDTPKESQESAAEKTEDRIKNAENESEPVAPEPDTASREPESEEEQGLADFSIDDEMFAPAGEADEPAADDTDAAENAPESDSETESEPGEESSDADVETEEADDPEDIYSVSNFSI